MFFNSFCSVFQFAVDFQKLCTGFSRKTSALSSQLAKKRCETSVSNSDTNFDISEYIQESNEVVPNQHYIENGLLKVYPYYFRHSSFCKKRWFNKTLFEVYTSEFTLYSKEFIIQRILCGSVKVNGRNVDLEYRLKNSDLITSVVHRHELPVLPAPISIIHEDSDILVVNKPPSIPVHTCSLYRYNSLLFLLSQGGPLRDLFPIHRLDRLVSGVLILAKCSDKSREMHGEFNLRDVKKEYICRVEGEFPDAAVTCNKPLLKVTKGLSISVVDPAGKDSVTEFKKMSFNGKSSVVLCKPLTGRTHQIRVHLQYLGYPILNDPLYNSFAFGPEKGKNGVYYKSISKLLVDVLEEHMPKLWLSTATPEKSERDCFSLQNNFFSSSFQSNMSEKVQSGLYTKNPSKILRDENCYLCGNVFHDPKLSNLFMFLHGYTYVGRNWSYVTDMPVWASEKWDIM